jgi:hypothetical protein
VSRGGKTGEMWRRLTRGEDGDVSADNSSWGPFIGARSRWKGKTGDGSHMRVGALRQSLACPGRARSEAQRQRAPREGHAREDFVPRRCPCHAGKRVKRRNIHAARSGAPAHAAYARARAALGGGLNGARAVLARGAARGVDVERLLLGIACGRSGARGQLGPRTEAGSEGGIGGGPRLLIRRSLARRGTESAPTAADDRSRGWGIFPRAQ